MALTFALLASGAGTAMADELAELKARNAQLEATVEELTLQLAETLSERKALEAQLADAVARLEAANAAAATAAAAPAVARASEAPPAATVSAPAPDTPADEVVEEAIVAEGVAAGAGAATAAGAIGPSSADSLASAACDVDEALRGYKRSGKANRALGDWLQSANHLKVCSTEQLRFIRKAVKFDFLGYEKAVLAMIDEELEAR